VCHRRTSTNSSSRCRRTGFSTRLYSSECITLTDLIILDVGFIQGRPKETRLALLKDINTRVAAAAGVSPDDMLITLYEVPGENISFGQGEAQRANAVASSRP
jgi:hypothetical protein